MAEEFQKYSESVKNLASKPSDDEMLELYGLFKQGTVGDCTTARPGMLDFAGKAKWDRWDSKKGMDQNTAKENYVTKAKELIEKYGLK